MPAGDESRGAFFENADEASPSVLKRAVADRQSLLRRELEDELRAASEALPERRRRLWQPDYASHERYLASVEPNRARWRGALGVDAFGPSADGPPRLEPFLADAGLEAWYLTVPWSAHGGMRAVYARPRQVAGPLPLVIAQHGIGSSPERVFGFDDDGDLYRAFGRRLVADGCAVLAPLHVTGAAPRARLQRLCLMLGGTLWGLEIARLQRLLDVVLTRDELDPGRVAMWGLSLGGAYTLFVGPLEPRIRVGVCAAWFNHRVRKMVVDDPRHSCFLSTDEEHVFVPGWLREFADADLAALWCPRPLLVQSGKADGIGWWPWIAEEIEQARLPYELLGCGERLAWELHEGGHEVGYEGGLAFLRRWL